MHEPHKICTNGKGWSAQLTHYDFLIYCISIGNIQIHDEMPKWNAQAKIPTKAEAIAAKAAAAAKKKDGMSPPDAKRRVTNTKLDLR
jgi:hypothetical protein